MIREIIGLFGLWLGIFRLEDLEEEYGSEELICPKCGARFRHAREILKPEKPAYRKNPRGGRELKSSGIYPKREPKKHINGLTVAECPCSDCTRYRDENTPADRKPHSYNPRKYCPPCSAIIDRWATCVCKPKKKEARK